ncbi:MAG: mucoidy inhibitor MuiA family protein [Deltaproteobacteria bacterium]|nr:mucoidy inhibitor MuiA family protein [Deltaproteobacteria bacterium]
MPQALTRAELDSVLVFRQGARVTRRLRVASGTERLRVGPLPLALADGSLRVRARGARVRDAAITVAPVSEPDEALRPAHDEALQAARLVEGRLEARLAAVRASADALSTLELPARARLRGQEPGPSPTAARLAVAKLQRTVWEERQERIRELNEELRRAKEARAALEEEARRASTAQQAREHELRKAVDLVLDDVGADAELTIEYDLANARWYPVYTLRFADDYSSARLEVRALVAQRTGEDWKGVRLTCSTATPQRVAELPELKSIRLGRAQPAPKKGFREPPEGVETLFADFDAGYPPERSASTRTGGGGPPQGALRVAEEARAPAPPAPPPPSARPVPSAPASATLPVGAAAPMPPAGIMVGGAPPPQAEAPKGGRGRRKVKKKAERAQATGRFAAMASNLQALDDGAGFGGMAGDAFAEEEPEPVPVGLDVDDMLLDFGALRMDGPDGARRGKLRAVTPAERYGGRAAAAAVRGHARGPLPGPPPRAVTPAPIDGYDHAYTASSAVHVPSDGAFHAVTLQTLESAAARRYVVVPRESRDVFRYVSLADPLGEPLLPGPLDVYVGDRFSTSRAMPSTPAGDRLELGLGVEDAIEVARNTSFEERTTGLMRGGLDLIHEVEVELENHLTQVAELEVRERMPVPADGEDDVEVEVAEVSPRWERWAPAPEANRSSLRGGYRWRFQLAASGQTGARKKLSLRYVIHISSKHALRGGNRRES